jgi:pantoate--beta-alanine ligase
MIQIIQTAHAMNEAVFGWKAENKKIGFVPTMGALHKGHLSLVNVSEKENDITVVSIFVNPTQFNDAADLEKYPRTLQQDIQLLSECKNLVVFSPTEKEMYPKGATLQHKVELGLLENTMEGKHRPGHFQGVVQVVKRLLEIVPASCLYMGQKDFQQFTIIRHMLSMWNSTTRLVVCPIIREKNGLAMSSRNERLSASARNDAGQLFQTLRWMQENAESMPLADLESKAEHRLHLAGLDPEYLDIVDAASLQPVLQLRESACIVACIAVWVEGVRLIDNIVLSGNLRLT